MKMKHNKKRNTLFIYESLMREVTKCVVRKDEGKRIKIISILKEFFSPSTLLAKDLSLYKNLSETREMKRDLAEKLIFETRMEKAAMNDNVLFTEQTNLINRVNKDISPEVFGNFVPNYKSLASIFQIFNSQTPIKQRVLLESNILDSMVESKKLVETRTLKPISSLAYRTFVKKFNDKYGDNLLEEQKHLLSLYIASFEDTTDLKVYLNEEVGRLKKKLSDSLDDKEFSSDSRMHETAGLVIEKLNSFATQNITSVMIETVLKTQELVRELNN